MILYLFHRFPIPAVGGFDAARSILPVNKPSEPAAGVGDHTTSSTPFLDGKALPCSPEGASYSVPVGDAISHRLGL